MINKVLTNVNEGIANTSGAIKKFITKTWIYKDSVVVIDFSYKGSKFAFDIIFKSNGTLELFLVDRNDNIVFLLYKSLKKKILLSKDLLFESLFFQIEDYFGSISRHLDSEYKYDISVVVPVYNRAELIQKCINSLNSQTFNKERYEVIFVDDSSTDDTISSIKKLAHPDLNFSVLERPVSSGNASIPRNEGIKFSKAKYVLFLDSDDYLSTDCLNNSFNLAEQNSSDVVFLRIGSDDENPRGIPIRAYKSGTVKKADFIKHHLSRTNPVFRLYRKSFLLYENILFDPLISVGEDKAFTMHVLSRTRNVSILADKYYVYITRHEGEHLSRKEVNLNLDLYLYMTTYNFIFSSDFDYEYKNQMYNMWTVKVIERLISIVKSKRIPFNTKEKYFNSLKLFINPPNFYLERRYIFKEFHYVLDSLIENNFDKFFSLVNGK